MKLRYYVITDVKSDKQITTLLRGDFNSPYVKLLYYPNFKAGFWRVTKVI